MNSKSLEASVNDTTEASKNVKLQELIDILKPSHRSHRYPRSHHPRIRPGGRDHSSRTPVQDALQFAVEATHYRDGSA